MASFSSRDLSIVPEFSFSAVESFARSRNKSSGDKHISKGVRYYAEKYIESIKGKENTDNIWIIVHCGRDSSHIEVMLCSRLGA